METSEGDVCVKPWSFEQEKFTVAIEACYLDQVQFTDSAELTAALQNAPIKLLEWTLVKQ